jgi:hypothetical protein
MAGCPWTLPLSNPLHRSFTHEALTTIRQHGGMGFFFEVPPGTSLPGGALLAVYYGRSNVSLQLKYKEAQKLFDMSDFYFLSLAGALISHYHILLLMIPWCNS